MRLFGKDVIHRVDVSTVAVPGLSNWLCGDSVRWVIVTCREVDVRQFCAQLVIDWRIAH